MASSADPPGSVGGSVADGVYILTSYTAYQAPIDGPLGAVLDFTLVIKAPDVFATQSFDGAAPIAYSGVLDTSGGTFKVDNTCPSVSPDDDPDAYSADGDKLTLIEGGKNVLVFQRVGDAP